MEPSLNQQLLPDDAHDERPSGHHAGHQKVPTRLSKLLTTNKAAPSQAGPRSIPIERKRQIRWLQLDQNGNKSFMFADKRSLVQLRNLRMPVRDLRVLDKAFMMEASSNLLVRERCIVVSMEHVRIIITPDAVYAPVDADCAEVEAKFLHRLEAQALLYGLTHGSMDPADCRKQFEKGDVNGVQLSLATSRSHFDLEQAGKEKDTCVVAMPQPINIPGPAHPPSPLAGRSPEQQPLLAPGLLASSSHEPPHGGVQQPADRGSPFQASPPPSETDPNVSAEKDIVPFETVMLEAALDEVCSVLAGEAAALVGKAYHSLDMLSKSKEISSEDLQLIRTLKNQHQKLRTRVDVVRMELEELLEDDKDLQKMCLSTRQELQEAARDIRLGRGGDTQSLHHHSIGHSPPSFSFRRSRDRNEWFGGTRSPQGRENSRNGSPSLADLHQIDEEGQPLKDELERASSSSSSRHSALRSSAVSAIIAADMEEMENLIESYFTQIGATSFKLRTLGAYIDDTEDYINLDMDAARNRLIRLEIMLTAATFALAFWAVIAGVLGENMKIYPTIVTTTYWGYIMVNVGMLIFCILVFLIIYVHARRRRLI